MKSRFWIIGMCVLGLSACGVQAPLDDAYHWEDRTPSYSSASTSTITTSTSTITTSTTSTTTTSTTTTEVQQTKEASESKLAQPTLEFTNVQDTTITVKIHR